MAWLCQEFRVILAESEEVSEAWFGEVDCGWDSERGPEEIGRNEGMGCHDEEIRI